MSFFLLSAFSEPQNDLNRVMAKKTGPDAKGCTIEGKKRDKIPKTKIVLSLLSFPSFKVFLESSNSAFMSGFARRGREGGS